MRWKIRIGAAFRSVGDEQYLGELLGFTLVVGAAVLVDASIPTGLAALSIGCMADRWMACQRRLKPKWSHGI